MATKRHKHIQDLLKSGKAVVINNNPFTVRLKYNTPDITQPLNLFIDTGRENIGLSVNNPKDNSMVIGINVKTNNKQIKQNMT